MKVVIGIDPHKASHTAVAIDEGEDEPPRRPRGGAGLRCVQGARAARHVPRWVSYLALKRLGRQALNQNTVAREHRR